MSPGIELCETYIYKVDRGRIRRPIGRKERGQKRTEGGGQLS
jgi:hypothetical protein